MLRKLFSICLFFISINFTIGQHDFTAHNLEFLPQRTYQNPSFQPFSRFYIGLPVPSIQISGGNNGFRFNSLFSNNPDSSVNFHYKEVIANLKSDNAFDFNSQIDLLNFGFRVKEINYFWFHSSANIRSEVGYSKNLFTLLSEGNGSSLLGKTADLSGTSLNAYAYLQFGLGYSREINDQLTIGASLKRLYGQIGLFSDVRKLSLSTDERNFFINAEADADVYAIGLNQFDDGFSPSSVFTKNTGWAVDLGAQYKVNDKIHTSASIVDLGSINWKQDFKKYSIDNQSFVFRGVDENQIEGLLENSDSTTKELEQLFKDSLQNKLDSSIVGSYRRGISPKVYLQGKYILGEKQSIGAMLFGRFDGSGFKPGVSLSFNSFYRRYLSSSLTASYYNRDVMLGYGASINIGPVQFHLVFDNLLVLLRNQYKVSKSDGASQNFQLPRLSKTFHARAGVSVTIGRHPLDEDEDGVSNRKDECPKIPGRPELKGCPDNDKDGIPNHLDDCKDTPGLPEFAGCPDTDGDGIMDKEDKCPNDPGLPEHQGCPDKDGDQIIDQEDDCPEEAGPIGLNGCPDRDGDNIADKNDACPDIPG